ncbi:MAG: class IV adenylate cyclase [Candidatus Levyibacteriota bacterium]
MDEVEIKFLDINPVAVEAKLLSLGAQKVFDHMFEEWIFQKPEWADYRGRVRVRAENDKTTIAYKDTTKKTSEGNVEIEFSASDQEKAVQFIEKLGIPLVRHQQKRRIHFLLNDVEIDIDFWPKIPPLVEIEGKTLDALEYVAKQLGFEMKATCTLDALQIIQDIYHVDLNSVREYIFD